MKWNSMELCRIEMEWQNLLELLWIESQLYGIELECDLEQSELNRNWIKASAKWMWIEWFNLNSSIPMPWLAVV